MTNKIFVGMSGGVDSSVSALLLKQQGFQIEGVYMKNWEADDTDTYCPDSQDMADAQSVCDKLSIPLHRINFADDYWQNVFTYFLDEYKSGRTPNPDILCNKEIKFKAFLNFAKQRGADFIATGHYVQTKKIAEKTFLLKGNDPDKDQSYFLHALSEEQLAHSIFPVGHLPKSEVRKIAKDFGLDNATKKDSTGICFIGERKFKTFLNEFLPAQPGNIETENGDVIGTHDGLMFHTIGQRQGLKIGGLKNKSELPWFVAKKDIARNVLIVVQGNEHPLLFTQTLLADSIHWINGEIEFPKKLNAKIRYRQDDQECVVEKRDEKLFVKFSTAQRAVTPGQAIVFYEGDVCLGGGVIL